MENPKIIEQTADYNIYEAIFMGFPQLFRIWHNGVTEIRFNDSFALANGYENLHDLLNKIKDMKKYLNQTFGNIIPEWITVDSATGFIGFPLLGTQTKVSLN